MIKNYKFIISEEDRQRILSFHEKRTKELYLEVDTQSKPKNDHYMDVRKKLSELDLSYDDISQSVKKVFDALGYELANGG